MIPYVEIDPATGRVLMSSCAADEDSFADMDPARCKRMPGIVTDVGGLYWDGQALQRMPPAPGAGYVFDWGAMRWRFDLPTALDAVRLLRDARLAQSDWVVLRSADAGEPAPAVWVRYRQALRDLPEQVTDEATYTALAWPSPPPREPD